MSRIITLFFLTQSIFLIGQIDLVRTFSKCQGGIVIELESGNSCKLRFISRNTIDVDYNWQDSIRSHAINEYNLADLKPRISSSKDIISLKNGDIQVTVHKSPFSIVLNHNGETLVKDITNINSDSVDIELTINEDDILYGGGARVLGMNRRGYRLPLYNRAHYGYETFSEQMNFGMPIVISNKGFLIHFDDPGVGWLDLDSQNENKLKFSSNLNLKRYQIVISDDWQELCNSWTNISGKQPLPPIWALGNFASRFGYHSQNEVEQTVALYNKFNIPLDAVILDLYWFGKTIKGTMGNLKFHLDSFPDPMKMINNLDKRNVKTILVTEPFVLTTSDKWEDAVISAALCNDRSGNPFTYDFYFGNTGLIDVFHDEGKKWFYKNYKQLKNYGIAGFWGDLGEPEVHPEELFHGNIPANDVHNIYGHQWSRMLYDSLTNDFPTERPFILMRAGYSGSQKYGMIPWSGDVNRSWGGLRGQMELSLQMGMQGMGYMHSDLGGFAGNYDDDELYIRWLQYGVFQPVYRPHAQEEVPSEPVFKKESTREIVKHSIQLRYDLLAYNYRLVRENTLHGIPLMRPLFFYDQSRIENYSNDSLYFWGDDFLVAPVLVKNQQSKKIYLPIGNDWINFHNGDVHQSGITITENLAIDEIPVFVRSGTIIPRTNDLRSTKDLSNSMIYLDFYLDKVKMEKKLVLYTDNNIQENSPSFESSEMYYSLCVKRNRVILRITKRGVIRQNIWLRVLDKKKLLDETIPIKVMRDKDGNRIMKITEGAFKRNKCIFKFRVK